MTLRNQILEALTWQGRASVLGQTLSWLTTLFVIRLLEPADYGLMASASVLLGLLAAISELGVGAAVIQARTLEARQLRDLQGLIWLMGAAGGLIMAGAGDLLVRFYQDARLEMLAPVLALALPLSALYMVPQALALREMRFEQKANADVASALLSAAATFTFALLGAGVWALVAGVIGGHVARVAVYCVIGGHWLIPSFSLNEVRGFIHFGLLASADRLLWFLLSSVDVLILGRWLGEAALGEYVVAMTLAFLPLEKIGPVITQVSFPAFAQMQDDREMIRRSLIACMRYGALVFVPIAWGAALVAPEALPLLLGAHWQEATLPFELICLVLPLRALSVLITPALLGTGRVTTSIVSLAWSLALMTPAFWFGTRAGLEGAALAWVLVYPVVFVVTTYRALRPFGMSLLTALIACRSALVAGVVMVGVVSFLRIAFAESPVLSLVATIPSGIAVYLAIVAVLEPRIADEVRGLLSPRAPSRSA